MNFILSPYVNVITYSDRWSKEGISNPRPLQSLPDSENGTTEQMYNLIFPIFNTLSVQA